MNGGRGNCGWAVMYEKRLKVKKKVYGFYKAKQNTKIQKKTKFDSLPHDRH